jgi:hypothetical protein
MCSHKSSNSVVPKQYHAQGLQRAHAALKKRLSCPTWGADDFYSAMAVYREVAGIEFNKDDDAMLDKWLDGAEAAWKHELKSKGDKISLAEALEKAIEGGIKAIGVRLGDQDAAQASDEPRQPEFKGGAA